MDPQAVIEELFAIPDQIVAACPDQGMLIAAKIDSIAHRLAAVMDGHQLTGQCVQHKQLMSNPRGPRDA